MRSFFATYREVTRYIAGAAIVVAFFWPSWVTILAAAWCVAGAFFFDRVLRT